MGITGLPIAVYHRSSIGTLVLPRWEGGRDGNNFLLYYRYDYTAIINIWLFVFTFRVTLRHHDKKAFHGGCSKSY